jgi:hypothetical protein
VLAKPCRRHADVVSRWSETWLCRAPVCPPAPSRSSASLVPVTTADVTTSGARRSRAKRSEHRQRSLFAGDCAGAREARSSATAEPVDAPSPPPTASESPTRGIGGLGACAGSEKRAGPRSPHGRRGPFRWRCWRARLGERCVDWSELERDEPESTTNVDEGTILFVSRHVNGRGDFRSKRCPISAEIEAERGYFISLIAAVKAGRTSKTSPTIP